MVGDLPSLVQPWRLCLTYQHRKCKGWTNCFEMIVFLATLLCEGFCVVFPGRTNSETDKQVPSTTVRGSGFFLTSNVCGKQKAKFRKIPSIMDVVATGGYTQRPWRFVQDVEGRNYQKENDYRREKGDLEYVFRMDVGPARQKRQMCPIEGSVQRRQNESGRWHSWGRLALPISTSHRCVPVKPIDSWKVWRDTGNPSARNSNIESSTIE